MCSSSPRETLQRFRVKFQTLPFKLVTTVLQFRYKFENLLGRNPMLHNIQAAVIVSFLRKLGASILFYFAFHEKVHFCVAFFLDPSIFSWPFKRLDTRTHVSTKSNPCTYTVCWKEYDSQFNVMASENGTTCMCCNQSTHSLAYQLVSVDY